MKEDRYYLAASGKDWHLTFERPDEAEIEGNPDPGSRDYVDIILEVFSSEGGGNIRYAATLATTDYIKWLFAKNKRTGENNRGGYVAIPNLILVTSTEERKIKSTVEDLIESALVDDLFRRV